MLDDSCQVQAILAYYDQREAEQEKILASLAKTATKRVYRDVSRAFAKERREMAKRRGFLVKRL